MIVGLTHLPNGHRTFDWDIKQAFGLGPKDKWPESGMPERSIGGVTCWVKPVLRTDGGRALFSIRARCKCPKCGAEMAIGRLRQHMEIHE